MIIKDKVYGEVKIDEPVLLDLVESKPLQRLKGIGQAGASYYAVEGRDVTRYEHSIGVMNLLQMLGAPLEEQIAGLLHDVPHTVFSHVIDFVYKRNNKDYSFHERFHDKIVSESEIPEILEKYGFSVERILSEHNFPLLEKNLPDLCADRIDYTLRDMVAKEGYSDKVNDYLKSFTVHDGEIIMNDGLTARLFAGDYIKMDKNSWSNPREVALNQLLADALKKGLSNGIITQEDLFNADDNYVYEKLKNSGDEEITKKIEMVSPNLVIAENPENFDFHVKTKVRRIDPKFISCDGSIRRVTEEYENFETILGEHKKRVEEGYFIRIVSN